MRKLLLLVTVALLGSVSAWAQTGTYKAPNVGDTFDYTVSPSGGKGTYTTEFKIFEITALWNTSTNVVSTAESFTLGDITVNSRASHTLNITYNTGAIGKTFLLVAITDDGCSHNVKSWEVKPVSTFQLAMSNVTDGNGTPYNTSTDLCLPTPSMTYDGGAISTNYGTSYLYYKVEASGFNKNYTITVTEPTTGTYTVKVGDASFTTDNSTWTPIGTPTAEAIVYVRVPVAFGNIEGINPEDITLQIDGIDSVGNPDADASGNPEDDKTTQTYNDRPQMDIN